MGLTKNNTTHNTMKCNCKKSASFGGSNNTYGILTDMHEFSDMRKLTKKICDEYNFDVPKQFHGDDDYLFNGFCQKCGCGGYGDVEYEIALRRELDNGHLGNELILTFYEIKDEK